MNGNQLERAVRIARMDITVMQIDAASANIMMNAENHQDHAEKKQHAAEQSADKVDDFDSSERKKAEIHKGCSRILVPVTDG